MKLNDVKCPNCGAILKVEEGKTNVFCQYCGNQIVVEDESSHTQRIVDEAKIKQIEAEKEINDKREAQRKQQLEEYSQSNKTLLIVWVVTLAVCLICGFIDSGFWALLVIDLVLGAIVTMVRSIKKP